MVKYAEVDNIRRNMIKIGRNCDGKVHWGRSLSCVEILYAIYGIVSNIRNKTLMENERDQVIVSKGQAALAMYTTMYEVGMIDDDLFVSFQKNGSRYSEEVTQDEGILVPCSTGSLGLGLSYAVGKAYAGKMQNNSSTIFVVVGDGECEEGCIWESMMFASQNQLDNLTVVVDYNGLQADGKVDEIITLGQIEQKFQSFGCETEAVDGHDVDALVQALKRKTDCPKVIIAKTIKGKGISFMENDFSWHDRVLQKENLKQASEEVGISC